MASDEIAIKVSGVSKEFKLPHEKQNSIKSLLINFRKRRTFERQKVLDNVSFDIKKGEFFGIVGRNGSGKSTLLKLIAEIYNPNLGTIKVNGKLTPFIELGVGFSPELTGRENVFLNGSLLGFSRKEMDAMYDDIVSFAELEKFMDQKLKNYSSGMQVRLAFSIAIRAKPDILLLDEVLAVGDEAFQRKCFNYFEALRRNKKTVVIVTHDMASVERFCTRAMFIEGGEIKLIGDPHKVAAAYSRSNDESYVVESSTVDSAESASSKRSNIKIALKNKAGETKNKFIAGETMLVEISWDEPGVKHVGVAIFRQSGEYMFGTNTYIDAHEVTETTATYEVGLNLGEGTYYIKVGIFGERAIKQIDFEESGPSFVVSRDKDDKRWGGFTKLEHKWRHR